MASCSDLLPVTCRSAREFGQPGITPRLHCSRLRRPSCVTVGWPSCHPPHPRPPARRGRLGSRRITSWISRRWGCRLCAGALGLSGVPKCRRHSLSWITTTVGLWSSGAGRPRGSAPVPGQRRPGTALSPGKHLDDPRTITWTAMVAAGSRLLIALRTLVQGPGASECHSAHLTRMLPITIVVRDLRVPTPDRVPFPRCAR